MDNNQENLLSQISNLRKLFSEATPTAPKVVSNYAWTIVKLLLQHTEEIDSVTSRQLLADCLKLPIERPSQLYSALLSAAVKVSTTYPDFRFAAFLKLWGIDNLRPEDFERQQATVPAASPAGKITTVPAGSPAGKSFPSLAEKTARALAHSLLLHPEDRTSATVPDGSPSGISAILTAHALRIRSLLVTRIKEAMSKEGRKLIFVTLTSTEGLEIECVSSQLQPSPLHPLPEGKRHYVNIGQLYDCLLKTKSTVPATSSSAQAATVPSELSLVLKEAYLSQLKPTEVFPTEIGYIESIDQQHGHMHIYDAHSRHFVAPILRFSKEKAGDFVRFIPIVPAVSKFKTAIIQGTVPGSVLSATVPSDSLSATVPSDSLSATVPSDSLSATVPSDSSEGQPLLREIRITKINKEKGYAAWELTDKSHPITELLSPLQLSQGESSPTFSYGYLNLTTVPDGSPSDQAATVPAGSPAGISLGQTLHAFIYLKRGKDHNKRPHIAHLF